MRTKIFKPLLAMACLLSSINASAYDFEVDGIYYDVVSLSEKFTCKVVAKDDNFKYTGDIVIPANVNFSNRTLTVVELSDKLFYNCSDLTGITIPNTINSIGNNMFEGCTKLERIRIEDGENVLCLGSNKHVSLGIGEGIFFDCPITSLYIGRNLSYKSFQYYGYSPFYRIETLKELTIGNSVTEIGSYAFSGCSGLTSVTIGNSVTQIGSYAFSGCSGLTSITIPNSVTQIGSYAFDGCSGLTSIAIPNSVTEISEHAFSGCSGLTSVTIPNSVIEIGPSAFSDCSSLESINIPGSVTKINGLAFYGCTSLKSFEIPNNVSDIAPSVFWNCPNITELHIGNGLDGLPATYYSRYTLYGFAKSYSTLWKNFNYYPINSVSESFYETEHLTGLKKIYIEDSSEKFSMIGYYNHSGACTHAFGKLDIDYYYVGRPLVNIQKWSLGDREFNVKYQQGYGHIDTLEIAGVCTDVPYFYQKIDNLILGTSVTYFDTQNVYTEGLKSIICKSAQPAQASGDLPGKVYMYTSLYIPTGSKEAYLNADVWKYFWNIIEVDMSDETDIISLYNQTKIDISVDGRYIKINNNGKSSKIEVYNAAGTLVYNGIDNVISVNCAGLYIVRVGGQTEKLIVR